jgi:small-conductance mechanosensitive channel
MAVLLRRGTIDVSSHCGLSGWPGTTTLGNRDSAMDQVLTLLERSGIKLPTVLSTVGLLLAAFVVISLLRRVSHQVIWRADRGHYLPYESLLTITRMVTGGLWLITLLLVLNFWGVSVSGVWTLLISAAAVIGVSFLAVWTIVSNITASFFITVWRPFHLGQTVEILPEHLKGRVIDRNMMFTVLRDDGGNVLQVPNNLFFQKMFRVAGNRRKSLFEIFESENRQIPA